MRPSTDKTRRTPLLEHSLRDRAAAEPIVGRDLTDHAQNVAVLDLADELMAMGGSELIAAHQTLVTDADFVGATSPPFLEALASAVGKLRLQRAIRLRQEQTCPATESPAPESPATESPDVEPLRVSIVFAMYGESSRILRQDQDPHGEDFLRHKVGQLRWLFDQVDPRDATWHLVAVDDGCTDQPSSGHVAEEIVEEDNLSEDVTVLRLTDAIATAAPLLTPHGVNDAFSKLQHPSESRKGGSILYGLHAAMERFGHDQNHLLLYTDADLSANLTQLGSLLEPLVLGESQCVLGQRYGLAGAILIKEGQATTEPRSTGAKPDKMIVLFRHQVRVTLIPQLRMVLDTQAGFKAFTAARLARSLPLMSSFNETFDVELLIHTSQADGSARGGAPPGTEPLAVEPIVFTEDFGQSNFPSVDPGERHLAMVRQIVDVYDRFVAEHHPAEGDRARLLDACRKMSVAGYIAVIDKMQANDARWPSDSLFDRPIDLEDVVKASATDRAW